MASGWRLPHHGARFGVLGRLEWLQIGKHGVVMGSRSGSRLQGTLALTGVLWVIGLIVLSNGARGHHRSLIAVGIVIVVVAVVTQIGLLVSWRRNSTPARQKREVLAQQLDSEPVPVAEGRIAIFQDMPWFGDPRMGAFAVYLDGKRVGTVYPQATWSSCVDPGNHRLRIRRWWYFSPALTIEVKHGSGLIYRADNNRGGGVGVTILRGMFAPWRALSLTPA
jgi:hypothetical protein